MVNVRQIADMGAYVKLLEYDDIDGMILLSELSRRRIRSIQKLIRVGRNECVVVLRVDKEKGYIDLSKRRVSPEDVRKCEERYNKSKMVHSIMRHVAEKTLTPIETLYEAIGWPLNRQYGHSLDAFKLSITYVLEDRGKRQRDEATMVFFLVRYLANLSATPTSGKTSPSPARPWTRSSSHTLASG